MIVTLAAALSFQAHINPRATLPEACAAIRSAVTSSRTVEAACKEPRCTVRTRIGRVVFQNGYITAVWPLSVVVSGGPL